MGRLAEFATKEERKISGGSSGLGQGGPNIGQLPLVPNSTDFTNNGTRGLTHNTNSAPPTFALAQQAAANEQEVTVYPEINGRGLSLPMSGVEPMQTQQTKVWQVAVSHAKPLMPQIPTPRLLL